MLAGHGLYMPSYDPPLRRQTNIMPLPPDIISTQTSLEGRRREIEHWLTLLPPPTRGKTDAECEEEFLDLVQEEQNYGVAVFQVQVSQQLR